jgi:hypothetical protein
MAAQRSFQRVRLQSVTLRRLRERRLRLRLSAARRSGGWARPALGWLQDRRWKQADQRTL